MALACYIEIDPYAAQWLRNLIDAGRIAPGEVFERSVLDVRPEELMRFRQVHLYAGIGVWSYALRLAGWPDDRPVWTFSEPCQPFSAAGKRAGFADERYLRPYTHHLVSVCRPAVCFAEQVASKDGLAWLDVVQADMEGEGYAVWAQDRCSAGVGAPHIRQRLYLIGENTLGDSAHGGHLQRKLGNQAGAEREASGGGSQRGQGRGRHDTADDGRAIGLANAAQQQHDGAGRGRPGRRAEYPDGGATGVLEHAPSDGRQQRGSESGGRCAAGGCGDSGMENPELSADQRQRQHGRQGVCDQNAGRPAGTSLVAGCSTKSNAGLLHRGGTITPAPGPTNGFWRDADWLFCRDGKWRPVEPGTFPLAHGAPARVGRLRAYGNAIDAQNAADFIGTYLDCEIFF